MQDVIPTNLPEDRFQQVLAEKTIILTGASGFIGTNLALKLLKLGSRVIGIDNHISGTKDNLAYLVPHPNFTFVEADVIQNPKKYLPVDLTQVDYIFHFASPASPPIYQKYPIETYLVNSLGTHHLLDFLQQNFPQAIFLYASTSEVYGNPLEHPQSEKYWGNVNPNGPRSCYDEGKRLGETISGVFSRDFGIDVRIMRFFNTYGPHMSLEDGRILPQFIKQYQADKPLTVYGDGLQTRSYCYIDDLVKGILLFASGEKEKLSGQTINLGNPEEYTVLDTARIFNRAIGRESELITFEDLPIDDPLRRQPDITKAGELLEWQPEINFDEGLRKTLDFFQK